MKPCDSLVCVEVDTGALFVLQQLWRYNTHAVEMRIDYLNSMTGSGTEAQTVMVNDIPEVNKVFASCRLWLVCCRVEYSKRTPVGCSDSILCLPENLIQPEGEVDMTPNNSTRCTRSAA